MAITCTIDNYHKGGWDGMQFVRNNCYRLSLLSDNNTLDEIFNWFTTNLGEHSWLHRWAYLRSRTVDAIYIYIFDEEDLMLFKLRWL